MPGDLAMRMKECLVTFPGRHSQARYRLIFVFFNDTATTELYTLSLHDALPIAGQRHRANSGTRCRAALVQAVSTRRPSAVGRYTRRGRPPASAGGSSRFEVTYPF